MYAYHASFPYTHTLTKVLVTKTASISPSKVNTLKDAAVCGQQRGWKSRKRQRRERINLCLLFHPQASKERLRKLPNVQDERKWEDKRGNK